MFLFARFSWLGLVARYPKQLRIFDFSRFIENLEVYDGF